MTGLQDDGLVLQIKMYKTHLQLKIFLEAKVKNLS